MGRFPVLLDAMKAFAQATPVTAVGAGLVEAVENRQARRWRQFVNELLAAFDEELELLAFRVGDDRIEELIHHGLRRSLDATREEQVRVLARIVADGVHSGAKDDVDKTHVLLEMAAGLEPLHILVLEWIGRVRGSDGEPVSESGGQYSVAAIEHHLTELTGIVGPLVAVLESRGLLRRKELDATASWAWGERSSGWSLPLERTSFVISARSARPPE